MERIGFPAEVIQGIRDSIDCNVYFFDHAVPVGVMYAVLVGSVALCIGVYVLLNIRRTAARS